MNVRMNESMDGWLDGWMGGWRDRETHSNIILWTHRQKKSSSSGEDQGVWLTDPIMCIPRILSVLESLSTLTKPSASAGEAGREGGREAGREGGREANGERKWEADTRGERRKGRMEVAINKVHCRSLYMVLLWDLDCGRQLLKDCKTNFFI